jgi:hypothetical protein
MIMTGENCSSPTETCPSAILSPVNRRLVWDSIRASVVTDQQLTKHQHLRDYSHHNLFSFLYVVFTHFN